MAHKIKLTIGEFSKFCQVTVKTLRHYEKLGLLVPNEVDEWTKYRYYDIAQMQQLNGILRLKKMGFSLEKICELKDVGTFFPDIAQIQDKTHQVEEMKPDTKLIKFKRLPEIPTALCFKYYGPYKPCEHVRDYFVEAFKYINEHGYKISAPYRTQYVEGPWNQKNPKKWLLIFQIPVTKAKSV